MKTSKSFIFLVVVTFIISCKKKETPTNTVTIPATTDNYASVNAFLLKNAPVMQTYTINALTGGSFTSPQGTTVNIPTNAFVTQNNIAVAGIVVIQFKDLYKKSDMLLADMSTMLYNGAPIKSGGEFFIKALSNDTAVILAPGKKITMSQPTILTGGLDNGQQAFTGMDTLFCNGGMGAPCAVPTVWVPTNVDSVNSFSQSYIFSLYQFNSPVSSGSWCNSDNQNYFSAYPQTTLNLLATDSVSTYGTNVFLLFKNLASMVHVYSGGGYTFPYYSAPQGLQCTVVAVGIKGGKLYSAFVPITIGSNQTVSFTLNATTTSTFTAQLQTLN